MSYLQPTHMKVRPGTRPGDFRGDGLGPFEAIPLPDVCPLCGGQLHLFDGYTERVIVERLCTEHQTCALVSDVPNKLDIVGCIQCKHNFTRSR